MFALGATAAVPGDPGGFRLAEVYSSVGQRLDASLLLEASVFRSAQSSIFEAPSGALQGTTSNGSAVGEVYSLKLADAEAFQRASVARYAVLQSLRFRITPTVRGGWRVNITSSDKLYEPNLQMLVAADTDRGLHLIPIELIVPMPDLRGIFQRRVVTRPGETLWRLASRTRPSADVSVNQQMLALHEQNPDAFISNNVNGLRSGRALVLPQAYQARRLNEQRAIELLEQQHQEWRRLNQVARQGGVGANASAGNAGQLRILPLAGLDPQAGVGTSPEQSEFLSDAVSPGQQITEVAVDLILDEPNELRASTPSGEVPAAMDETPILPQLSEIEQSWPEPTVADAEAGDDISEIVTTTGDGQPATADVPRANSLGLSPALTGLILAALIGVIVGLLLLRRYRAAAEDSESQADAGPSADEPVSESDFFPALNPALAADESSPAADAAEKHAMQRTDADPNAHQNAEEQNQEGDADSQEELFEFDEQDVLDTRLKLAEAYLQMGDILGAREMLEEVLALGNQAHRDAANQMIRRMDGVADE